MKPSAKYWNRRTANAAGMHVEGNF